mmetsp:Transcript_89/g.172  ORF Transcript_89/g.172 Transcript_89/m.172 type:complete len:80 (+) Transcript_89:194-433(+)
MYSHWSIGQSLPIDTYHSTLVMQLTPAEGIASGFKQLPYNDSHPFPFRTFMPGTTSASVPNAAESAEFTRDMTPLFVIL